MIHFEVARSERSDCGCIKRNYAVILFAEAWSDAVLRRREGSSSNNPCEITENNLPDCKHSLSRTRLFEKFWWHVI